MIEAVLVAVTAIAAYFELGIDIGSEVELETGSELFAVSVAG